MISLVLSMLCAQAAEYPKVVRKAGEVCVQSLDASGAVTEACRADTATTGAERAPLPARSIDRVFTQPTEPTDAPRAAAPLPKEATALRLHWAEAKRNWALAFKISSVTLATGMVLAFVSAAALPGNVDSTAVLGGGFVSGLFAGLSALFAVLLDSAAAEELTGP